MLGVTANKARNRSGALRLRGCPALDSGYPLHCPFQHPLAEIQACYFRAAPGQPEREVTRAATEVQRPLAGLRACQLDYAPLPKPVQAKTLDIIDQVVARRDSGKEIMHLRGALVAGIVEGVGHGG